VTVYLTVEPGVVRVQARLEGPGGVVGDLVRDVRPGDELFGLTYEQLAALGDGAHDVGDVPAG
jgi:hypothetical protein